ncbi:DUF4064 domain-containing protein [Siminovitchia sediminis]|uniref:DUF4064 domain-containing protein n=1 Tax=Siminovitchia sediminis TaxID=1274353 RepID=A0ABW4KEC1_9BACI
MKRTAEMVLGIIGIITSGILLFFGGSFIWANKSEEFKMLMTEELAANPAAQLTSDELSLVMEGLASYGWALVIASLIGMLLGLIGVIRIKGNKNPKLAGWMFIAAGVSIGVISVGFGFLPAILYLIAGIMSLVRKPPPDAPDSGIE